MQLSCWNIQKGKATYFGDSSVNKTKAKALQLSFRKNKADTDIFKRKDQTMNWVLKQSDLISRWQNIISLWRAQ